MPCCDSEDAGNCVYRKRIGFEKSFKYRSHFKGNGKVCTTVCLESPLQFRRHQDYIEEVQDFVDGDNFDLPELCGIYSLGKRRRWELPDVIAENLPESGHHYGMDIEIASVSYVHLTHMRNQFIGLSWPARPTTFRDYISDRYGSNIDHLIVNSQNGMMEKKGKLSRNIKFLPSNEQSTVPRLHVQYVVEDFEFSHKLQNSGKWHIWKCNYGTRSKARKRCLLNKVVEEGIEEANIDMHLERYPNYIEEFEPEDLPKRAGFVLGDFVVSVHRKVPRRHKHSQNFDWEFIVEDDTLI